VLGRRASDWHCRVDLARCPLAAEDGGDDDKMDIDEGAGAAGGDGTLESLAEWLGKGFDWMGWFM